jgi:hypothetical protein
MRKFCHLLSIIAILSLIFEVGLTFAIHNNDASVNFKHPFKNLSKALYLYSKAANEYFES